MLIKRHYDPAALKRYRDAVEALEASGVPRAKATDQAARPAVAWLEIKHTGSSPRQNFSTSFVAEGMQSGLVSIDEKAQTLTIHAKPQDLVYAIKRRPGYYCCHDGKRIEMSPEAYGDPAIAAVEAQQYLKKAKLDGKASPDPQNPAGYARIHCYECELEAAVHAKFKAKPGALAMSMKQGV